MSTMTDSRTPFSLLICILALFVAVSPSVVSARFSKIAAGGTEFAHLPVTDRAGSRGLLQSGSVDQCPYDFSKLDFSSVTSVCKGPSYDAKLCCSPFNKIACVFKPLINNFNSLCPIYFLAYLNVAGGYPDGVFVGDGRCNSGKNLCPS